jgi:hypothetical protein
MAGEPANFGAVFAVLANVTAGQLINFCAASSGARR